MITAACIQLQGRDVHAYEETKTDILNNVEQAGSAGVDLLVLPELAFPAYFLSSDEAKAREALNEVQALVEELQSQARRWNTYLAVGLPLMDGGSLKNSVLLLDPKGKEVARAHKMNLWHFDYKWFQRGQEFTVVDTDLGPLGLMICADARLPEIPRILALKGASILIDPVNLVTGGPDPQNVSNPQLDYMLRVRARENGVWILVANKVGMEAGSVAFAGGSCVIDPQGQVVKKASPYTPEILFARLHPETPKPCAERQPKAYHILVEKTEDVPALARSYEEVNVSGSEVQGGVVRLAGAGEAYLDRVKPIIAHQELQDTQLLLLPQPWQPLNLNTAVGELQKALAGSHLHIALPGYRFEEEKACTSVAVFSRDRVYGLYDRVHGGATQYSIAHPSALRPLSTPLGNLSIMMNGEGYIPEVARACMLGGADAILWSCDEKGDMDEAVMATRATENRLYILRSSSGHEEDYGSIVDPMGRQIAATFRGQAQVAGAPMIMALSRSKTVLPGTSVLESRTPDLYGDLIR